MVSEMTQKRHTALRCLLAGVLIIPAAGNGTSAADGAAAGLPPVTAVSEPEAAAALYHLGVSRMNGEGVGQDIVQGRYWIHLAARHGYPLAQYNLGVMYFDGIGGTYSRQCAQWWLTGAAGQDDAEVREMARQALQRIEPEMAALPKVYRPVTAAECDRLPEWRRETQPGADIPVLPEGDTDTEKMMIAETPAVTGQRPEVSAESELAGTESGRAETFADNTMADTASETTVKETAEPVRTSSEKEPPELPVSETESATVSDAVTVSGASETAIRTAVTAEQKTPLEYTGETVTNSHTSGIADTTSTGEITEPETVNSDGGVLPSGATLNSEQNAETGVTEEKPVVLLSVDDDVNHTEMMSADTGVIQASGAEYFGITGKESMRTQEAGQEALSGTAVKNTEMHADARPEKPKIVKPREIIPAPGLNLGGSPATASGNHYTLQLSGGTTADELYRTARRHKLTNYVVYETERHGQRWYVLVAGEYATLTAANQALKRLPAELRKNKPWVRTIKSVQSELK